MTKTLITLFIVSLSLIAQGTFAPVQPVDLSKVPTQSVQTGVLSAIPVVCKTGQLYFAQDAAPGLQLYHCSSTNTWTVGNAPLPTPSAIGAIPTTAIGQSGGVLGINANGTVSVNNTVLNSTGISMTQAALPATCVVGSFSYLTSAPIGLYHCPIPNTWCTVPIGDGGSLCSNSNLASWKTALSTASSAIVDVAFVGDSITYGNLASTLDTKGYVGLLRTSLQAKYGGAGRGLIPAWRTDLITYAGSWGPSSTWGIASSIHHTTATGDTATITAHGTTLDLYYISLGNATITIDAAAPVAVGASFGFGEGKRTFSLGASGDHTVIVTTTGEFFLDAFRVTDGTKGVQIHSMGLSGAVVNSWDNNSTSLWWWDVLQPKLTVIALTINDYGLQTALAAYSPKLVEMIVKAKAYGAVIVMATNNSSNTALTITELQYHAAAKAAADANGAMFLDIASLWGPWTLANQAGYMGDALHPSDAGHAAIAAILSGIL
jgi:lysophospholipase L1-like esterase